MIRFAFSIFLLLAMPPLFAQAPLTLFGDLNIGNGRVNPGVGVGIPVTSATSMFLEASKTAGSVTAVGGFSHDFVRIKKDAISLSIDVGAVVWSNVSFIHEYSVKYSRWIDQKWSIGPYVKYSVADGIGGWSAGATVSFRHYR